MDAEIPAVFAALPSPPSTIARCRRPANSREVLAALDTYRKTSPEMVVFGRMLDGCATGLDATRSGGQRDTRCAV